MNNDFNIETFNKIKHLKLVDFDDFYVDIYEKDQNYYEVYFSDNDTYREVSNIFENDDGTFTLYYIEDDNEASVDLKIKDNNEDDFCKDFENCHKCGCRDTNYCDRINEINDKEFSLSIIMFFIIGTILIGYYFTK